MRSGILHSLYKFFPARECDKYTVYILLTLLLSAFKGTLASGTTQSVLWRQTLVPHARPHSRQQPYSYQTTLTPRSETWGFQRPPISFKNYLSSHPKRAGRRKDSRASSAVKSRRGGPEAAAGKWRRPAAGVCPTDSNEDHTE